MRRGTDPSGAGGRILRRVRAGGAAPERVASLALVAIYAGALAFLPWLPATALLVAAAGAAASVALVRVPADGRTPATVVMAAGVTLHLVTLASGGLASPVLVAFVPWIAWAVLLLGARRRAAFVAAAAAALIAADARAPRGVAWAGAAEALLVVACGLGVARWLERLDRRVRAQDRALSRIRDEADSGRPAGETAEAARRLDELSSTLDRVRRALGAEQAVLWDVDPMAERARPRLTSGAPTPSDVPLKGDPLGWAWDEGLPMRIDGAPRWAGGHARACVLPLEPRGERAALLSLAFAEGVALPETDVLDDRASRLRELLHTQRREALAVATRERFALVTDVLRLLPREMPLDALSAELASAGMRLAGASGAAVALWEDDAGRVLAVAGDDGGPDVGATFGPLESEMALAARHATPLIRERRRGDARSFPVAAAGERWLAEPGTLVVVPLEPIGQGVIGALAVWRAEPAAIDPGAIELLETLAPYAAFQLDQARRYDSLQEYAERDALTGLHNRRMFESRMKAASALYDRHGRPVSLILLDVDHFKRINDTYGHEAGDAVLRAVAACIGRSIRESDLAARYGGEEFVVLLQETGLAGARETAERLRRQAEASPVEWHGRRIEFRVSLGVSAAPECVRDPRSLVDSADRALYASKEAGRNRVTAAPVGVDAGP